MRKKLNKSLLFIFRTSSSIEGTFCKKYSEDKNDLDLLQFSKFNSDGAATRTLKKLYKIVPEIFLSCF